MKDQIDALFRNFSEEELAMLAVAMEDHYEAIRHNESDVIGQLYDGDDSVGDMASGLLSAIREASDRFHN